MVPFTTITYSFSSKEFVLVAVQLLSQVLGKDLVVWRDAQEHWTCFDDRCPHRAAPLTEGRVEKDGSLL